jgi:hypothetical protein
MNMKDDSLIGRKQVFLEGLGMRGSMAPQRLQCMLPHPAVHQHRRCNYSTCSAGCHSCDIGMGATPGVMSCLFQRTHPTTPALGGNLGTHVGIPLPKQSDHEHSHMVHLHLLQVTFTLLCVCMSPVACLPND